MSAPTLARVVEALERIAPLEAAADWDNVGLLVESVPEALAGRILLCIDLTESVMEEAATWQSDLIVAYHPPLFSGATRLTQSVPLERSILRAIRAGIAIYSPHTALDAARDGMCDWLAKGLGPLRTSTPIAPQAPPGDPTIGAGRLVTLAELTSLDVLVDRIKAHLGLTFARVATHARHGVGQPTIRDVALCPGAGGGLFGRVSDVDLLVTGEMQHHDVLARVASGAAVILTEHSNSERGFLSTLRKRLASALGGDVEIRVSQADAEPLAVM